MALTDGYGIAIIGFLILSLVVGTLTSRLVKRSSKRYMVAGKSLPLFFVGTMLAAQSVDGNSSLGNASLVYQFGFWGGAAIPIGLGICLLLTGAFYGKRLNKMSMLTLPDFYYRRFGKGPESISAVLLMVSFTILVAGNFAATGFILQATLGIEFLWAVLIGAIVVLVYTFAGGLFSSAYTDIFQIYLAIIAFWAAFLFFYFGYGILNGESISFEQITANAPPGYLDLSGLTDPVAGAYINWAGIAALALGDIVALDFMERVFAAKDPKTAQRGAFWGGGLTLFTVLPTSMLGIVALTFLPVLEDPFLAYPELALNYVPFPIGAALLMGVLGASMSTANGGLLAISSVISRNLIQRDILRGWMKRPGMEDRKLLITTRIFTVPMMIAAFILAYMLPQPGIYLILAFDIVFAGALAPLTLGLFWKKANMPAAMASLIAGTVIRLVSYFLLSDPAYTPWQTDGIPDYAGLDTMIPPVISFALFIGVALATQKKYPGEQRHGVVDYVPPEEDVVRGEDLKGFVTPAGSKLA